MSPMIGKCYRKVPTLSFAVPGRWCQLTPIWSHFGLLCLDFVQNGSSLSGSLTCTDAVDLATKWDSCNSQTQKTQAYQLPMNQPSVESENQLLFFTWQKAPIRNFHLPPLSASSDGSRITSQETAKHFMVVTAGTAMQTPLGDPNESHSRHLLLLWTVIALEDSWWTSIFGTNGAKTQCHLTNYHKAFGL